MLNRDVWEARDPGGDVEVTPAEELCPKLRPRTTLTGENWQAVGTVSNGRGTAYDKVCIMRKGGDPEMKWAEGRDVA